MSDTKHGWVTPRADGARARCGGPGVCATCDTEAMHEAMLTGVFGVVPQAAHAATAAAAPCPTCNDQGAVGNILTAQPCPDCTPAPSAPGDAQDERKPLFWYRPRSDGGYEGPIHNDSIEEVRKQSGAWVPLYPGFAALPKPLSDLRYHGELIRGWNQCLREVSASVAAPAAGDAQDAQRYRWLRDKSTVSMGYASFGLFSTHQRDMDFLSREEGLQALDAAIDAALAAQVPHKGDAA